MQRYSKEFKAEALKLSDEIGIKKASAQLGVHYNTIADWRKLRKCRKKEEATASSPETLKKIRQLEKELAELQQANGLCQQYCVNISRNIITYPIQAPTGYRVFRG